MRLNWRNLSVFVLAMLALVPVASAHPGHEGHGGIAAGLAHPLSGIDHLCAMLAVGLLAAQLGGRAIWLLPLSFVSLMIGGGALASAGVHLPMVEQGIIASVFVLGIFIAFAVRWPTPLLMAIVGAFAMFHGFAHVSEMELTQSVASYGLGFILATTFLHLMGIVIGLGTARLANVRWVRLAGVAIACCGLLLTVGIL